MSKIVNQFSLKYRPEKFSEVKGQEMVVRELKSRAKQDNWPTAMLFQGPTGVGKSTLGFITAASIQCSNPTVSEDGTKEPCGKCPSCKDIFLEKFTMGHTVMLDGSTSSKDDIIDNIAALAHSIPHNGKKQIFIIEEIDQLSASAKNSFHKLLEKPSPFVHFILLSMTETNGNKVPESIATRCQTYHLKDITETDVAYLIRDILKAENMWEGENAVPLEFKKKGLFLLANNAKGSMRRAIQFLERVITGGFYSEEDIEEVFHFISEESSLAMLKDLMAGNNKELLESAERLTKHNKLMDWVFFTHYLLVGSWSERERGVVPYSPGAKLLHKYQLPQIQMVLDNLYTPILQAVNTKGWIGNSHLIHLFLKYMDLVKKLRPTADMGNSNIVESTPGVIPIRMRGSSSSKTN